MGFDGPSSRKVPAFVSEDFLDYGNGRLWQNTNGLIFLTRIQDLVSSPLIDGLF